MSKLKRKVGQNAGFCDLLNWRSYSSLQKLLIVVIAVVAISWLSSLWTLIVILIISVGFGVNISKKVSQRHVGQQYAQEVQAKLQECTKYLSLLYVNFKFIAFGHGHESFTDQEILDDANPDDEDTESATSVEKDVFSDDWSISRRSLPVKVPCDVYLEINSLQLLIVRDFIQSWYSEFSYDPHFLKESKFLLQQACNNIVYSLSCQNTETIAITIIKHFQVHVGMYRKAKSSYKSHQIHPKTKISNSPSIQTFQRLTSVEEAFDKEFSFHDALVSPDVEYAYLKGIVSIFLLSIIPNDVFEGKCAKSLLVEILTTNVMLPLMELISDPDWLMEKIILITSDEKLMEPEHDSDSVDVKADCELDSVLEGIGVKESVSEKIGDTEKSTFKDEVSLSLLSNSNTSSNPSIDLSKKRDSLQEEDRWKVDTKSMQFKLNLVDATPRHSIDDTSSVHSDDVFVDNVIKKNCDIPLSSSVKSENSEKHLIEQKTTDLVEKSDDDEDLMHSFSPSCPSESCGGSEVSDNPSTDWRSPSPFVVLNENIIDNDTDTVAQTSSDSSNIVNNENSCIVNGGVDEDSVSVSNSVLANESDMDQRTQEDELLSSDEIFSSDSYENIELDPQKIISYVTPPNSVSQDPQSLPDPMTASFSKLSSIKNFFVDSFKTGSKATSQISKPKTLALFSDKFPSNLNPLSSKLLLKNKSKQSISDQIQITPQLLIDDKPILNSPADNSESLDSSQGKEDIDSPASAVSAETSPGFFSNFPLFYSKSSSQTDLYIEAGIEESPIPTPSPTSHSNSNNISGGNSGLNRTTDIMSKSYVTDDRRMFQEVSIPLTSTQKEYGSNSKYSLYVIEYDALYFTEEGKSVMKSGTVKRRYREFNNLQSRLEGYPTYKKYLKNIKGPKRWPTLPFKTLDKDTVKNRRVFMERYLQDLIQIEAICNGPDLREFLAYEGDSHIAFVKKSPDVNVLRIDKMLMRGMSEVVDRLKSLPNIPQEVMSGFRGRDAAQEKAGQVSQIECDADSIEVEFDFDGHGNDAMGSVFSDACHVAVSSSDGLGTGGKMDYMNVSQAIKDLKSSDTIRETYQQEIEKVLDLISKGPSVQRSPSSSSGVEQNQTHEEKPGVSHDLSAAVLDLVAQGLEGRDHWLCKENVMTAVKTVLGQVLDSYLKEIISDLTSNPQLVTYLRLARHTVWPQGQLWTESRPQRTLAQKEVTRQQAKRCLIQFFPAPIRLVLGEEEFEAMMDVFLGTLHNERLNRHLIYQLMDTLIQHLFPDVVSNKETLHKLLFSRTPAEGYL